MIVKLMKKLKLNTVINGCIDPGWLTNASIEEVEEEAKKEIDIFKKDGGFILSTGCEYLAHLDFEKAKAIIKVANEYGKY